MSMPTLGDASDGLQPIRLFNRGAVEEKGEGARLVRMIVCISIGPPYTAAYTRGGR